MRFMTLVTLFLFALSCTAQTLLRPEAPYLKPLPNGQLKAGLSPHHIVIAYGDEIIPQIANSGTPQEGGFYMIFQASNVSKEMATFEVNFFDANGESMNLPLAEGPDDMIGTPASGFQGILSAGGYGAQVTVPNGSAEAIGYAVVRMDPEESVAVNATFVNLVPGKPPFMAGVPLSSVFHKTAFMPYLAGGGFTPSLALVSLQPQQVTLIARSGFEGDELCRATMSFGERHHRPFLLRDVLPCTDKTTGTLEIRGDPELPASIAGIGFEGHEGGAFVTQPIWTNLARNTEGRLAPEDEATFNDRFVGKRALSNFPSIYWDFVSPGRFEEIRGENTWPGSYSYRNTDANTGTLTFNFDDGDSCTAQLTFHTVVRGAALFTCDDSSREYEWSLVEIPSM